MSEKLEEQGKEQTPVEKIQELISTAPEAVEAEFKRTANTWMECFSTRLSVIETWFDLDETRNMILTDQYTLALQKLDTLKDRFFDLRKQYPDKETIPPEEIKRELFEALNILQ